MGLPPRPFASGCELSYYCAVVHPGRSRRKTAPCPNAHTPPSFGNFFFLRPFFFYFYRFRLSYQRGPVQGFLQKNHDGVFFFLRFFVNVSPPILNEVDCFTALLLHARKDSPSRLRPRPLRGRNLFPFSPPLWSLS